MEHTVPKLGTALAAAVLGLGLPAVVSAQEANETPPDTSATTATMVEDANAPEMTPISDAIAALPQTAQTISNLAPLSADDVVPVSLSDIGLTADQRYALMQQADPSAEATLQQALATAQVAETGSLAGDQRTLADHLRLLGIDPASVVAADVDSDGTVTVYYQ